MISNGTLMYGSTPSSFDLFRPSSLILYQFILALITTLISYQVTATVLDLFLGFKPYGSANVSDMQTLRLVHAGSPLAVFRALFPNTTARFFSKRDAPVQHQSNTYRMLPILRLFFLLAFAPLVNIASVIATLEYSTTLTFADAKFGGVALGINEDFSTLNNAMFKKITRGIWQVPIVTANTDTSLVQFIMQRRERIRPDIILPQEVYIEINSARQFLIGVMIVTPGGQARFLTTVNLQFTEGPSSERTFLLRHSLNNESILPLMDYAVGLASEVCGGGEAIPTEPLAKGGKPDVDFQVARKLPCEREFGWDIGVLKRITLETSDKLTIVQSGRFDLGSEEHVYEGVQSEFISADRHPFLRRRRNFVSFGALMVILGVAVVFRIGISCATNNDLGKGIGLVIRRVLEVPGGDSLLCCDDIVIDYERDRHAVNVSRKVLERPECCNDVEDNL